MPTSPNVENYTLGKGIVSFKADTYDGETYEHMGNAPELSINVDLETLEHFSSMSGAKSKDKEIILSKSPKFNLVLDEISPDNIALNMLGTTEEVTQSSGTDGSASLTSKKGAVFDLGKRDVSSVDIATYTEGTDFIVYEKAGVLFIPTNSTIPDETSLSVTFEYAAITYQKVKGYSASQIEGQFMYVAANAAGSDLMVLKLHKVALKPGGDLAFIGDDWLTLPFEGEILAETTNHADNPYLEMLIQ